MDSAYASPCVLILGLPKAAFCGVDLLSFTTSPKFQGIKNLTPGWHFVFASGTNSFSLRQGVWFYVERSKTDASPQVFIVRWDAEKEELAAELDESSIQRHRANIGSIWRDGLTPYRQTAKSASEEEALVEEKNDWGSLTDCITPSLLCRITAEHGTSQYWTLTSASSAAQDFDDIPGLTANDKHAAAETELGFLPIDLKQTWREGAVGRERTEAAQDRSWALKQLIERHCDVPSDVIGEQQFCFAMVLTLNNNSCMEQWKRLLSLLLTCRSAPAEQPSFFSKAIDNLRLQLQHCEDAEGGLFDLSDESGNLLKRLLKRFRAGLDQASGEGKIDIIDELDELDDYMREQHGWVGSDPLLKHGAVELEDGERVEVDMTGADEEDETGEYAPTLVDLSPEQLRELHGENAIHLPMRVGLSSGDHSRAREVQELSDDEGDEDRDLEEMDARY